MYSSHVVDFGRNEFIKAGFTTSYPFVSKSFCFAEYYVKMTTPRLYEYNFEELLDINDFEKDIKIIGNKFDKEED